MTCSTYSAYIMSAMLPATSNCPVHVDSFRDHGDSTAGAAEAVTDDDENGFGATAGIDLRPRKELTASDESQLLTTSVCLYSRRFGLCSSSGG